MKKIRLTYSHINLYPTLELSFQKGNLSKREAQLKQLLKSYYEVKSSLLKGTMVSIVLKLEQRLDVILVRMYFAKSLLESRQFINHRKVKVNGKVITSPNTILKPGALIEIQPSSRPINNLWNPFVALPSYLEVEYSLKVGTYFHPPLLEQIPLPFALDNQIAIR